MKSLGRPRRGWEDKIEMHHNRIEWDGMAFILAQYKDKWKVIVKSVMKVQLP